MNLSFSVWVTTACNLKCTYCYEGDDKPCMYLEKQQAERVVNYSNFPHQKLLRNLEK